MAPELAYIRRFEPGADPTLPPVLLLHGTGETDLVELATEPPSALQLPGDERDDVGHDGRSRLIHRRGHMGSVG